MIALGSGKGFQSVYLSAGFSSLAFLQATRTFNIFSDPGKVPKHGLKKIGIKIGGLSEQRLSTNLCPFTGFLLFKAIGHFLLYQYSFYCL